MLAHALHSGICNPSHLHDTYPADPAPHSPHASDALNANKERTQTQRFSLLSRTMQLLCWCLLTHEIWLWAQVASRDTGQLTLAHT